MKRVAVLAWLSLLAVGCGGAVVEAPAGGSSQAVEVTSSAVDTSAQPPAPAAPTIAAACGMSPPSAAANVAVSGGTADEEEAARAAVSLLGDASLIDSVSFTAEGRAASMDWRHASVAEGSEGEWQAELIAPCLVARLLAVEPDLARLDAGGSRYSRQIWPRPIARTRLDPAQLASLIQTRAKQAGLALHELDVLPNVGPAVRVVVRLREDQLFASRAHQWLHILYGYKWDHPDFLSVEAPDGTPVFFGWSYTTIDGGGAGSASYGGETDQVVPLVNEPVPAYLDGPTELHIVFTTGLKNERYPYDIRCQPQPTGVVDAASVCGRLLSERWALFVPKPDTTCAGGVADQVTITGTLGGTPIDTDYDQCWGPTVQRWEQLVGLHPVR